MSFDTNAVVDRLVATRARFKALHKIATLDGTHGPGNVVAPREIEAADADFVEDHGAGYDGRGARARG